MFLSMESRLYTNLRLPLNKKYYDRVCNGRWVGEASPLLTISPSNRIAFKIMAAVGEAN